MPPLSSHDAPKNAEPISEQDVLAVVSGIARPAEAEQIWSEALQDKDLRQRLTLSLPPEDEGAEIADAVSLSLSVLPERLQRRRDTLLATFAKNSDTSEKVKRIAERVLRVLETVLTLPYLAPALAAPEASQWLGIQTQTVVTEESVRVEFQQLPPKIGDEDAPPLLRVIVDASELHDELHYTRAFVTVAKEADSRVSLSIPLNARAVGYLDTLLLSPSATAHRIIGVTLQEG